MKEMMSADFVDHSVLPGQDPGREGYLRLEAEDQASFSNIRRIIEDQVADGDKVITRLTVSGTHDRGQFVGAAPTGTEMFFTAIVIHRVSGGKIVEEWSESGGLQEITQRRLASSRCPRPGYPTKSALSTNPTRRDHGTIPITQACSYYPG